MLVFLFSTTTAKAIKPGSYGRIFNVQDYIAVSASETEGINRCLSDVALHMWDISDMQTNSDHFFTILFPYKEGGYLITEPLRPDLSYFNIQNVLIENKKYSLKVNGGGFAMTNHVVRLNVLGLDIDYEDLQTILPATFQGNIWTAHATYPGVSANYALHGVVANPALEEQLSAHLARVNMHCNGNPASGSFLSYAPSKMPFLKSTQADRHNFFVFEAKGISPAYPWRMTPGNTATKICPIALNMMGLCLVGEPNATNSHIYNPTQPSVQHDIDFTRAEALKVKGFYGNQIDNMRLRNIYGNGVVIQNRDYAYRNGNCIVDSNVIENVWGLRYRAVYNCNTGAKTLYDDGGDGIVFEGTKDALARANYIINHLDTTFQYGRIGLSLSEHNKGANALYNQVHGYDRGIHMENGLGGFYVLHNRLTGSETGIVYDGAPDYSLLHYNIDPDPNLLIHCVDANPSYIRYNYISNEGIVYHAKLCKIYPPHLFFGGGTSSTNESNYSEVEKNFFFLDHNNVHLSYFNPLTNCPGNPQTLFDPRPYPFEATDRHRHIRSVIKRQKTRCNVMESPSGYFTGSHGGFWFYSGFYNEIPDVRNCPALPQDAAYNSAPGNTIPVSMQENFFPDNGIDGFINHFATSAATVFANAFGGAGNTLFPALPADFYTNSAPPNNAPNCAQAWNNTLCNGKPIVAEHDYLWDNHILSNSAPHSGKTIIVGGVLQINADVTFTNCTFLMASGASIDIANGHTLTLNGCTLMAACDQLWYGIIANDPSEQVEIVNGTVLRDMEAGVQIMNGAKLLATNSMFQDNSTAMQIGQTPAGYVSGLAGNQGVVTGNTFTSTGTGPLFGIAYSLPNMVGVKLVSCAEVLIGGNQAATDGNSFTHLSTGIDVQPAAIVPAGMHYLYHNHFADIRQYPGAVPDISDILQNTYGYPQGTAIHIRRPKHPVVPINWGAITTPEIKIKGNLQYTAFARCDKAVMGTGAGVELNNYTLDHCVAGVMIADAHFQNYRILSNTMNHVMAGVQLLGNFHYASIKANNITLTGLNAPNSLPNNPIPDPRGVDVQYWTNLHNGQCSIEGNTITIPGIRGMGVSLTKNGAHVSVSGNTVHFTTTNQTAYNPQLFTSPLLRGIYSALGDGNQLRCNVVNGLQSWAAFENRNSRAIDLWQSKQSEITCNQVNNTHLGISAMGNCYTTDKKVKANLLSNHVFGLSTWPGVLSDEGDLGDVGLSSHDNNNAFNGIFSNPDNFRTLRYYLNSNNLPFRRIYTQNLSSAHNGSLPTAGFGYDLWSAANPQNCLSYTNCGNETGSPLAVTNIDEGLAMNIAQDSMVYFLFPEVAEWAAKYELYSDLERDSVLLATNAILSSFYQTQMYQDLGIIRTVEQKLRVLTDSTTRNDSALFAIRLQDAVQTNNSISGTQNYIQHEKWIHSLSFKIIEFGRDSLSIDELDSLAWLANSCPAAEGLAVYKARVLQAFYTPLSQYDDYSLCNPASKGGKGPWDDMLSYLQNSFSAKYNQEAGKSLNNIVKAYPNPTNDIFNIAWDFSCAGQGNVELFDITGRLVLQKEFNCNSGRCELSMHNFPSGLYTYKLSVGAAMYTGKLSKHD